MRVLGALLFARVPAHGVSSGIGEPAHRGAPHWNTGSLSLAPRPRVAIIIATGSVPELSHATLDRKLRSAASFLLPPLREVSEHVDVFACLDKEQPTWQTQLVRLHLQPKHTWFFDACSSDHLSADQHACCTGRGSQALCDAAEYAGGGRNLGIVQFFRLSECYRRVEHASTIRPYDFYVRARADLHWVGPFDAAASLLAPTARQRLGLRYRSCAGIAGLTLGSLQMPWYKVGPDACGEARWQTDYPCFTADDQFAVVPASLGAAYFHFALERLSAEYAALQRASPRPPPCSCWHCVEGRLTEYLLLRGLSHRVLSLAATYVWDDKEGAPLLLPETAGAGGAHDPVWSPSVPVRCAARNGSWGVAAWLARTGLIERTAEARLASLVNVDFSMKGLMRKTERSKLLHVLARETAPQGLKAGDLAVWTGALEVPLTDALADYSSRFLERNQRHERCADPAAASLANCNASAGTGAAAAGSS